MTALDTRFHPFLSKVQIFIVLQPKGDCIHSKLFVYLLNLLYFNFSCPPIRYILLAILIQAPQGSVIHKFSLKLGDSLGLVLYFQALFGCNCA